MTTDNGATPTVDVDELCRAAADTLAQRVARAEADGEPMEDHDRQQVVLGFVGQHLNDVSQERVRVGAQPITVAERDAVTNVVLRQVFSLVPGLEDFLADERITDIYVNGYDDVRAQLVDGSELRGEPFVGSDAELVEWIQVIARRAGREKAFNPASPELRTRLADGSRFSAAYWICERPYVAIRCHRLVDADLADLAALGMFDPTMHSLLAAATRARLNMMIAGDFGIGKTTLLRALLHECASSERIVVLEQEPELRLADSGRHDHVLSFTTRGDNAEGRGAFQYGDLSRVIKWFRPRRVVVGEVQGPEVVDMLEVVTAGRGGAACTIHSESASTVFQRIPIYARAGGGGTWRTSDIKELTATAIQLVVYLDEATGGRRVVSEVRQVVGYDQLQENIVTNAVFVPGPDGAAIVNPQAPMPIALQERLVSYGYRPPGPADLAGGVLGRRNGGGGS